MGYTKDGLYIPEEDNHEEEKIDPKPMTPEEKLRAMGIEIYFDTSF